MRLALHVARGESSLQQPGPDSSTANGRLTAAPPRGGAGDEEARARGTQKTVLERVAPPTFPLVIEMRERAYWVTHWVEDSVDCLLHGKVPIVQARARRRTPGPARVQGSFGCRLAPAWMLRPPASSAPMPWTVKAPGLRA